MIRTSTRAGRAGVCVLMMACAVVAPGCETGEKSDADRVVRTLPPPGFATISSRYNERVARLNELRARAVVRIAYTDEKGERRQEQGEGILQAVRPDKLALSINKAGKRLFWFGGDAERYWLFDVIDEPVVRVGRHDRIASRPADAPGLGIEINPKELVRLLGITPLPIVDSKNPGRDPGTTAWSKDGRRIEVSTPIPGGVQVIAMDPETFLPASITLLDTKGRAVIGAAHENFEPVDIANYGGVRPRIASRVTASHAASGTEIKLDLYEMRNSGVSPKAFVFDELKAAMVVERVVDLDAPAAKPAKRQ